MTKTHNTVVLPVLSDGELTHIYHKQVVDLAFVLREAAANWANQNPGVLPASLGAGFYAALWDLTESLSPNKQETARMSCFMTLMSNHQAPQLIFKTSSQLPS